MRNRPVTFLAALTALLILSAPAFAQSISFDGAAKGPNVNAGFTFKSILSNPTPVPAVPEASEEVFLKDINFNAPDAASSVQAQRRLASSIERSAGDALRKLRSRVGRRPGRGNDRDRGRGRRPGRRPGWRAMQDLRSLQNAARNYRASLRRGRRGSDASRWQYRQMRNAYDSAHRSLRRARLARRVGFEMRRIGRALDRLQRYHRGRGGRRGPGRRPGRGGRGGWDHR